MVPTLTILATSRQPLGVPGEVLRRLDPLEPPEAVELFRDRVARRGSPEGDRDQIARVCTLVDRLPLAIELAAALTPALTVEQVADRLADPLRLLTAGGAASPTRHRSLRTALASSWELLDDLDRLVVRRLAAFAGTWSLEAAETVVSRPPVEVGDVAPSLARLVDASLVSVVDAGGERRYRFLSTVRHLAAEELVASGEEAAMRARVVEWLAGLVSSADLRGAAQAEVATVLHAEHDNLRAVIESSVGTPVAPAAAELATAVFPYWIQQGHYAEGRRLLTLVGREANAPVPARATALAYAGLFAIQAADLEAAEVVLNEGLPLAREGGTPLAVAQNLYHLGFVHLCRGWPGPASERFAEVLRIAEEIGTERLVSAGHDSLGQAAVLAGDEATAAASFDRSLALIRAAEDVDGMLRTMANQAAFAAVAGRHELARSLVEEGWGLAEAAAADPNRAEILRARGLLALVSGDRDLAVRDLESARDLFVGFGAELDVIATDLPLAWAMLSAADRDGARVLVERAMDRLARTGADRWRIEGLDLLAAIAHARDDGADAIAWLEQADRERVERGMHRLGWYATQAAEIRAALVPDRGRSTVTRR